MKPLFILYFHWIGVEEYQSREIQQKKSTIIYNLQMLVIQSGPLHSLGLLYIFLQI